MSREQTAAAPPNLPWAAKRERILRPQCTLRPNFYFHAKVSNRQAAGVADGRFIFFDVKEDLLYHHFRSTPHFRSRLELPLQSASRPEDRVRTAIRHTWNAGRDALSPSSPHVDFAQPNSELFLAEEVAEYSPSF